jgi:hypothetical protein
MQTIKAPRTNSPLKKDASNFDDYILALALAALVAGLIML